MDEVSFSSSALPKTFLAHIDNDYRTINTVVFNVTPCKKHPQLSYS